MQMTTELWQSTDLLTPPDDIHQYRVLLRRKVEGAGITICSIDAEIRHLNNAKKTNGKWQPVEKYSTQYGEILQVALLEIKRQDI